MNKRSLYVSLAIMVIVITIVTLMAVPVAQGHTLIGGTAAILIPSVFVSVAGVLTLIGINIEFPRWDEIKSKYGR